jgi:hypothetical protein
MEEILTFNDERAAMLLTDNKKALLDWASHRSLSWW